MPCRSLVVLLVALACGCGEPPKSTSHKSPPPARITNGQPEDATALVTLTPRAVERLGIVTVPATRRPVPRWRRFSGRVEVRPGARFDVVVPYTGRVSTPEGGVFAAALARVKAGDRLASLTPVLSPERQVLTEPERVTVAGRRADLVVLVRDAEAAVELARARVEGARLDLDRSEKLVGESVSQRDLEAARTTHAAAEVELRNAERKLILAAEIALEHPAGAVTAVPVVAGRGGMIETVAVAEGQFVAAGSTIATILDDAQLLLTVPVYVGDLRDLAPERGVRAGPLDGGDDIVVTPVAGPPGGDPAAATVYLHFGLDNRDGRYRPGERLGVRVRAVGDEEALVVPWSAVHYDFNGGAWVYVAETDVDYRRHRVDVDRRDGDLAVLHSGPAPGASVVSVGAVELFGTEFGTGK